MEIRMASENYHEPRELLSEETRNLHRAIVSLIEELEAIDWYQQRAQACSDPDLQAIIIHNQNEEIEHATMVMEWLRRHHPQFNADFRRYLFTDGPITAIEVQEDAQTGDGDGARVDPAGTLMIGGLKGR
jgi:ferritin-like protein